MISVGIDPGMSGAVVVLGGPRQWEFYRMPTQRDNKAKRDHYDVRALCALVRRLEGCTAADEVLLVTVEKSMVMPKFVARGGGAPFQGNGAIANFARGEARGFEWLLVGMGFTDLAACRSRRAYQLVHPKTWQNEMLRDVDDRLDTKSRALEAAKKLFPKVDLRVSERAINPHEGIVDALLLAEYGRWKLLGSVLEPKGVA